MGFTNKSTKNITSFDEVSFFDIISSIIKNKKTILISVLGCSSISLAYYFNFIPTYQSQKLVDTTTVAAVMNANIAGEVYSKLILHKAYILNFESISNKTHFFESNNLSSLYCKRASSKCRNKAINLFVDKMKFNIPASRSAFSSELSKGETDEILENYTHYINNITTKDVIDTIIIKQNIKKNAIKHKINQLVKIYNAKIENEILELDEAILLVKKLNYKSTQNIKNSSKKYTPLYSLGYDHLIATKSALLARKSIETYIPEIHKLNFDLGNIKTINHKTALISAVEVGVIARHLKDPIYPNILWFLIFGIAVGLFVSFLIIMFKYIVHAYRQQS